MNSIAYFEIQAANLGKAITFYRAVFGWKFEEQPGLPIKYWRIATNGLDGGLLERPAKTPPQGFGTNAFTCSVEVENFDKTAAMILKNGGQVALPKFAVPGRCWQGYFVDTENNVFGIFQVDSHAK